MQMHRFFMGNRLLLATRYTSTSYSISFPSPSGKQMLKEVLRRQDSQLREDSDRENVEEDLFSGVESIAAINLLKNREARYDSFSRRKSQLIEEKSNRSAEQNLPDKNWVNNAYFPLLAEKLEEPSEIQQNAQNEEEKLRKIETRLEDVKIVADRGFFVQNYMFCDEYHRASADELPDHEMNEIPYRIVNSAEVDVELIPFNEPGGEISSINLKKRERHVKWKVHREEALSDVGEWMDKYSDEADEVVPPLKDVHCAGCGASFHCNSSSFPGFVPVRLFQEIERNAKRRPIYQRTDYLCRRCFLYKEYQFLLNVNVCDIDYRSIMGHLKLVQEALILLVVDMTDLHSSIFLDLPEIIGEGKPMIVIGNKIDLLPPDALRGYLKRYQDALKNTVAAAGFGEKFNILKFSLVSAKNGYGIEDLITNIYSKWMGPNGTLRSNIYVVGCTNAGKSTLFNTFLQSDLCKVRALDLVERVTTSIWPGTTLSLLKFPIWNPSSFKLEMRRRRLLKMYKWRQKEKHVAEELYKKTQDTKYITLQGFVGNTFKEQEEEQQPQNLQEMSQKFYGEIGGKREVLNEENDERNVHGRLNLNDPIFLAGNWCYDTPGTVNNDQILHLLTLDELINVIPRRMIVPRTFITYEGDSILIGGIGRIDLMAAKSYNDQPAAVFLTVFASDKLPLNCLKTADVKRYLTQHRGSEKLGAPLGNENRICQFPPLRSHSMWIENTVENPKSEGCADVALSSVGWVSVTSASAKRIRLRAWTPDARGIVLRTPPIVRNAVELRGRRIPGTAGYETLLPAEIEESIYSRGRHKKQSLYRISHQLTDEMKPSGWAADGKSGRDVNESRGSREMASYDPRAVSFHLC